MLGTGTPSALPRHIDPIASGLMAMLRDELPIEQWRAFLKWRTVTSSDAQLPDAFVAERAAWNGKAQVQLQVNGLQVDPIIDFLNSTLPQQLDRLMVDAVLDPGAATQAKLIAGSVKAAMRAHVDELQWARTATRDNMRRILDATDIVFLAIDDVTPAGTLPAMHAHKLLANTRAAAEYEFDRRVAVALASRTSRTSQGGAWWSNEPHYNRYSHSVILSTLAVQAFMAIGSDAPSRYGSFGSVVAHELVHLFGAPSDVQFPTLPLDWLDGDDVPHFNEMTSRAADDYAAWTREHFDVSPPAVRFIGEDLADLGGVAVALKAFTAAYPAASVDGFLGAYATAFRQRQSHEDDVDYIEAVPAHALYSYRINGSLANLPAFAEADGCVASDAMVRPAGATVDLW